MYVRTRTTRPDKGRTVFYNNSLLALINQLKQKEGKHIFCDGGAEIIDELLQHRLIDELTISIVPTLLGKGTKLFKNNQPEQVLELVSSKAFDTGLVQLHYKKKV